MLSSRLLETAAAHGSLLKAHAATPGAVPAEGTSGQTHGGALTSASRQLLAGGMITEEGHTKPVVAMEAATNVPGGSLAVQGGEEGSGGQCCAGGCRGELVEKRGADLQSELAVLPCTEAGDINMADASAPFSSLFGQPEDEQIDADGGGEPHGLCWREFACGQVGMPHWADAPAVNGQ